MRWSGQQAGLAHSARLASRGIGSTAARPRPGVVPVPARERHHHRPVSSPRNGVRRSRSAFDRRPALLSPSSREMLGRRWGRIVNISARIAAQPALMIGGNAYATSKAALEAHTLNLAAEVSGTGVTVNAYRPGSVDSSMQGWIRGQPAEKVGSALRDRFVQAYEQGALITPERSAAVLLDRLKGEATGTIWDADDR